MHKLSSLMILQVCVYFHALLHAVCISPSDGWIIFTHTFIEWVGISSIVASEISFYQTSSHLLDIYIQDYEIIMKSSLWLKKKLLKINYHLFLIGNEFNTKPTFFLHNSPKMLVGYPATLSFYAKFLPKVSYHFWFPVESQLKTQKITKLVVKW